MYVFTYIFISTELQILTIRKLNIYTNYKNRIAIFIIINSMKILSLKMRKMKKTFVKSILVSLFISLIIMGCKKDEVTPLRPAPTISFITDASYITGDATVFSGDTVLVGLQCDWNGTDAMKTLTIYVNDVVSGSPEIIPENYAQTFKYLVKLTKSDLISEKWVFEIADAQGEKSSVSLTLTTDAGVRPKPTIEFITGVDYTSADKSVLESTDVLVGIHSLWNDIDAIKNITVYKNDIVADGPIDIPQNSYNDYSMDYHIIKGTHPTEVWKFEVTDAKGQKSSVSINLALIVPVTFNQTVTIGAQECTTDNSYYSLSTNLTYNAADASNNQGLIDFIGAYDATNFTHITSPGATIATLPIPYPTDMANWTIFNNTMFSTTLLSASQFEAITTVDQIKSQYLDPKKKAKDITVDYSYTFLTNGGKYGIFKVISITPGVTGKMTIKIKM